MIGNGMGQGLAWASVALMEHTGVTGQRGPLTASAVHRLGGGARLVVCNQLDATWYGAYAMPAATGPSPLRRGPIRPRWPSTP